MNARELNQSNTGSQLTCSWDKNGHYMRSFSEDFGTDDKMPLSRIEDFDSFKFNSDSGIARLVASKLRSKGIVEHVLYKIPRPVLVFEENGCVIYANRAAELLLFASKKELIGLDYGQIIKENGCGDVRNGDEKEAWLKTSEGSEIPVLIATSPRKIGGKSVQFIFCTDISQQKEREQVLKSKIKTIRKTSENLKKLVKTDPLTNLMNRRGLEMVLGREVDLAKRSGTSLIAALIDLDDFKAVNESFGHAGGDMVLKAVASTLRSCLRSSDWIGRVGGDEFVVLLPDTDFSEAVNIAERMRAKVEKQKIEKDGQLLGITTSTGLAKL